MENGSLAAVVPLTHQLADSMAVLGSDSADMNVACFARYKNIEPALAASTEHCQSMQSSLRESQTAC